MTRIWNTYLAPACLCQVKLLKLNLSPRLWKWTEWIKKKNLHEGTAELVQLLAIKLLNHKSYLKDLLLTCFHFWITPCLLQKLQSVTREQTDSHFVFAQPPLHSSECFRNINECILTTQNASQSSSTEDELWHQEIKQFIPCQTWRCVKLHLALPGPFSLLYICRVGRRKQWGNPATAEVLVRHNNGTMWKPWALGYWASLCLQSLPHFWKGLMGRKCNS